MNPFLGRRALSLAVLVWMSWIEVATSQTVATRERIAVIEFEGIGVERGEAGAITERLRQIIGWLNRYDVLTRRETDEPLSREDFDARDCADNDCFIKAGKLLNVEKVLAGQVRSYGRISFIYGKVIDVETGDVVSSFSAKTRGISDVYADGVPLLVENLFRVTLGRRFTETVAALVSLDRVVIEPSKYGVLSINVSEQGADIYINNNQVGLSPVPIFGVKPGLHLIGVGKPGFLDESRWIQVAPGDTISIDLGLRPRPRRPRVLVDEEVIVE